MKKILSFMALTFTMMSIMASCSSDKKDEPTTPLVTVEVNSVTPLDEKGEMTVVLTPAPKGAQITSAKVNTIWGGGTNWIEPSKLEPMGDGKYKMILKVTDFSQVKSKETVSITFSQTGGTDATADVTVEDPYSIEDQFSLVSPGGFNYYSADKADLYATGLPVIIVPEGQGDLAQLDINKTRVIDGTTTQKLGAAYFVMIPMEGETGFTLKVNPEKLAEAQEAVKTFEILNFRVLLTGRYNRVASLHLTAVACAPQTTVENDELTLSHADLLNPDFEKNFKFDATSKLRHIGVWGNGKVETEEIGLVNEQGTLLDDTPQFITPVFTTNTEGKIDCDVYLSGDPQCNYNTGTYYDIIRCRQPWKYNGKTYNPVCADMKFKIVIK